MIGDTRRIHLGCHANMVRTGAVVFLGAIAWISGFERGEDGARACDLL